MLYRAHQKQEYKQHGPLKYEPIYLHISTNIPKVEKNTSLSGCLIRYALCGDRAAAVVGSSYSGDSSDNLVTGVLKNCTLILTVRQSAQFTTFQNETQWAAELTAMLNREMQLE